MHYMKKIATCIAVLSTTLVISIADRDSIRAESFEMCMDNSPDLVSTNSKVNAKLTIIAHKSLAKHIAFIDIYWIDFTGKWHFYKKLKPGQSHVQPTYEGHQWVAKAADGACSYIHASAPSSIADIRFDEDY